MHEDNRTSVTHREGQQTVQVEKLVYGGDGLSRLASGEVVFIPWAAPGDDLLIQVDKGGKKMLQGVIREIIKPSPHRVTAKCSVFGTCGGCQWQHMDLAEQQSWKQRIVEESLSRIGKLKDITVNPTLGTDGWHTRNKAEWLTIQTQKGIRLGYAQRKSHQGVAFDTCWIIPERMNDLAHTLEKHLPPLPGLDRVQARINEKGEMLLSFIGDADIATPLEVIIPDLLPEVPELVGSVVMTETETIPLYGTPYLIETLGDLTFRVSPESFFQINRSVTAELLDFLNTLIDAPAAFLLDLYAGVGLFAISLNKKAEQIIAVESSAFAITDAEVNLEQNGIQNVELQHGAVETALTELDQTVEIALVDPPRSGCPPEVLQWLSENTTRQILYVSCDPTTLARDLKQLTEAEWRIETVQPFDMFPQTFHVETVVSLKRGD